MHKEKIIKKIMVTKLQRIIDNIELVRLRREEYYKASPKGKGLIQKEVNILLRRIRDMVQDISNVGKGNISKVTYVIKNSEGTKTFEEEFIGLDEEEIRKLFEVRKFFTASSNYEILRIEKYHTQIREISTN